MVSQNPQEVMRLHRTAYVFMRGVVLLWAFGGLADGAMLGAQPTPWYQWLICSGKLSVKYMGQASEDELWLLAEFDGHLTLPGTEPLGAGNAKSLVLAAFAPNGQLLWHQILAIDGDLKIQQTTLTPAGGLLLWIDYKGDGSLLHPNLPMAETQAVAMLELGPDGLPAWALAVGEPGDKLKAKAMVQAPNGDVWIGLSEKKPFQFLGRSFVPVGGEDIFLFRLSPTGALQDVRHIFSGFDEKLETVVSTPSGGLCLVGEFTAQLNLSESVVLRGGRKQGFVACLDGDGQPIWATTALQGSKVKLSNMAASSDGKWLFVGGEYEGTLRLGDSSWVHEGKRDVFVAALDAQSGVLAWHNRADALEEAKLGKQALHLSADGRRLLLSGEYKVGFRWGGPPSGPVVSTCEDPARAQGSFLALFDTAGTLLQVRSVSGINGYKPMAALPSADSNRFWVVGSGSAIQLDSVVLYSPSSGSAVLALVDDFNCWQSDTSQDGSEIRDLNFALNEQVWLFQNYPNPFGPSTQLNYQIRQDSHVRIALYDAKGQLAAVLADEWKARGNYQLRFDNPGLAPGLYYARLEALGRQSTIRMAVANYRTSP